MEVNINILNDFLNLDKDSKIRVWHAHIGKPNFIRNSDYKFSLLITVKSGSKQEWTCKLIEGKYKSIEHAHQAINGHKKTGYWSGRIVDIKVIPYELYNLHYTPVVLTSKELKALNGLSTYLKHRDKKGNSNDFSFIHRLVYTKTIV